MYHNSHELSERFLEALFKTSFNSLKAETGQNPVLVAGRAVMLKSHS